MGFLKPENECRLRFFSLKIPAKVGAIVFLWLNLIVESLGILFLFCMLDQLDLISMSIYTTSSLVGSKIIFWSVLLGTFLFNLLPICLALFGIHQHKPSYLKPFTFVKKVQISLCTIVSIIFITSLILVVANLSDLRSETWIPETLSDNEVHKIREEPFLTVEETEYFLVFGLVFLILSAYFLHYLKMVIRTYYLEMKMEEKKRNRTSDFCLICQCLLTDGK